MGTERLVFPIEWVEVSTEKSLIYHPGYKGERLDVYAKDATNRHFNVEMQPAEHRSQRKNKQRNGEPLYVIGRDDER